MCLKERHGKDFRIKLRCLFFGKDITKRPVKIFRDMAVCSDPRQDAGRSNAETVGSFRVGQPLMLGRKHTHDSLIKLAGAPSLQALDRPGIQMRLSLEGCVGVEDVVMNFADVATNLWTSSPSLLLELLELPLHFSSNGLRNLLSSVAIKHTDG